MLVKHYFLYEHTCFSMSFRTSREIMLYHRIIEQPGSFRLTPVIAANLFFSEYAFLDVFSLFSTGVALNRQHI